MSCSCLICTERTAGRDAATAEVVRKSRWCVLRIPGPVDFAYTVGLWHSFRRPELVMFGLDGEDMQHWLNTCVQRCVEDGWPTEGEQFTGVIEGVPTQLRVVHRDWHDPLFGTAHRFYGVDVPFRQVVWPDKHGRWPWDDRASSGCRGRQARTWLPVSEHPAGGWRLVGELEPGFPFASGPDVWALTTRAVLGGATPTWVLNEAGCFDVLDDRRYDADDLCLAYLGELVIRHPGLVARADLADGHSAAAGNAWQSVKLTSDDLKRSEDAWQTATP
ncbi:DUF4262 domain-containing protein [Allokutzneria albata]|uniref:DUF4262 domain-containing protein n=1 Tax=Allokutzneria albata TaxID=211114 RepID=UPI00138DF929|nr:DUF4262 domain-containing protein [Allokutzneria albata]